MVSHAGSAAAAASASRPRVSQAHPMVSDTTGFQEEAKMLRERRFALEDAIRQERSRRLQAAALRKRMTANSTKSSGLSDPPRTRREKSASNTNEPPQTLEDYRRELENVKDARGTFFRSYYTRRHLDPADVHLYSVPSQFREKRCPAPRRSVRAFHSLSPTRKSGSGTKVTQPSSLALSAAPAVEAPFTPWTRSALLRMQSNKRSLKRIQDKEKEEAMHLRWASRSRTVTPSSKPNTSRSAYRAQVSTGSIESSMSRPTGGSVPLRDVPHKVAVGGWRDLSTSTPRWRPSRQRSPLRVRGYARPMHSTQHDSPFKPTLKYGFSTLPRAERTEGLLHSSTNSAWGNANSWRTRDQKAATYSGRNFYDSAQEQMIEKLSAPRKENYKTRVDPTQWLSPPKERRAAPSSPPQSSTLYTTVVHDKSVVEVSPLTPTPKVRASPQSNRDCRETAGAAVGLQTTDFATPEAKATLLDGFRMPRTFLKREDLFQGLS